MSDTATGPDSDYKASVRREWAMAAPGWARWFDVTEAERAGRAVTAVLLKRAELEVGNDVLDVGAGYGEPGLTAAALVGPTGSVTCLDISGDMLAFAEARARRAGLKNVTFVEADVEMHEVGRARYDVVLSRAALMYASDPLATLRRLHAALRPGGRLAAAVWATPEKVAFAAPVGVMLEMDVIEPPPPGPGPFALGADGALEGLVREAKFDDVEAGNVTAVYELPSPEACTQWLKDVAPPITELVAEKSAEVQDAVWARVTGRGPPFRATTAGCDCHAPPSGREDG